MYPKDALVYDHDVVKKPTREELFSFRHAIETHPIYNCSWLPATTWNLDDENLERFLYCTKNDLEQALVRYFQYHTTTRKLPYVNLIKVVHSSPSSLSSQQSVSSSSTNHQMTSKPLSTVKLEFPHQLSAALRHYEPQETSGPLRYYSTDKFGIGILVLDFARVNPDIPYMMENLAVYFIAMIEYLLQKEQPVRENGVLFIVDHQTFHRGFLKAIVSCWKMQSLFFELLYKAIPIKIKYIFNVNLPSWFHLVWNMLRPFHSQEQLQRVFQLPTGDLSVVVEKIGGMEFLPEVLGGEKKEETFTEKEFHLDTLLYKALPVIYD